MRTQPTRAAWALIALAALALSACAQGKVITDPILYPAIQATAHPAAQR